MAAKQTSLWKMHIFSHIFPTAEHTWKPVSTERRGFPCISPPFPHMQSFQSKDLQRTHKETSAFKHKKREKETQMTPAQQTRQRQQISGQKLTHSSPRGRSGHHTPAPTLSQTFPDTQSYSNTNSLCAPTGTFYCSDVALSYSQQTAMTFIFQLCNFFLSFQTLRWKK